MISGYEDSLVALQIITCGQFGYEKYPVPGQLGEVTYLVIKGRLVTSRSTDQFDDIIDQVKG